MNLYGIYVVGRVLVKLLLLLESALRSGSGQLNRGRRQP